MIKYILFPLLCLMIISITSCIFIKDPEVSIILTPVPVTDENMEEDKEMELKPIKQFSNYAVNPAGVYGINQGVIEKVVLKDTDDKEYPFYDFFLIDGEIFFSAESIETGDPIPDTDPVQYETIAAVHYFKQIVDEITEVGASGFPSIPASEHIEFESGDFKIINFPYEIDGIPTITSRVFQGTLVIGYLKIDGCALVSGGLWYSVAERIETRYEGVYFWSVGGSPRRILDRGRVF